MQTLAKVHTDTEFSGFYGRNGWVKMGAIEVSALYSRAGFIIEAYSSRNEARPSPAIMITMRQEEFEEFCLASLAGLMGLSTEQLVAVLGVARYPFENPQLLELLGIQLGKETAEMNEIGRKFEEYMQSSQYLNRIAIMEKENE